MKIWLLILSFTAIYSLEIWNASEFIENLRNSTPANETILKKSIENTLEFLKHYIFYTISSDPPQPDFDKSYFPKKDIPNLFKNIKTENTNYFDFKNEFFSAVYQLNDLHTQAFINWDALGNYYYICPLTLISKYFPETKITKMYGEFSFAPESYTVFKNYKEVVRVIQENLEIPIRTINKKNPFDFIQEFAGINLRNKHSTYVFKQKLYTKNNLNIPVTLEDLTNFEVVYENNQSFETEYIIQNIAAQQNNITFYKNHEDNEKFISFLLNKNNKLKDKLHKDNLEPKLPPFNFKNLDDITLEFEKVNNVQSNNIFLTPNKIKNKKSDINWDYSFISKDSNVIVFQCRVDEINNINVMKIDNFGSPSDSDSSLDVAEKCAYLFDKNKFPIAIIFPRNGGGNPIIGYNILELLSPYILTRNTLRIKKDVNMTMFIDEYNEADLFQELNTTNKLKGDYILDDFVTEKYGDKIEEFSKPFAWRVNQGKIEEIKKKLKYKRIPTEIVIFTDGFALSAASIFMKNAYKSGAGIIIGYNGNPNLPDDIFDISQSPSAIFGIYNYRNIYPEIYQNFIKYPICLYSITCMASYHEFQESYIPQEYDVQNPDVRMNFYNEYDNIYYQEFINKAFEVLNSYNESCNPKHEMLVLFSDDCKFDNHKRGGFKCGSDYKWNKSDCIPVYCDAGYYYNKISNSCIEYPMEKDKEEEEDNKLTMIIIISSCGIGLIIFGVVLFIIYKKKKFCFKESLKKDNSNLGEYILGEDEDDNN